MERNVIDIEKLHKAVDSKRRQDGLSWARLAYRIGVKYTTLVSLTRGSYAGRDGRLTKTYQPKKDIAASIFVACVLYLKRPMTDFIKKEVVDDAFVSTD